MGTPNFFQFNASNLIFGFYDTNENEVITNSIGFLSRTTLGVIPSDGNISIQSGNISKFNIQLSKYASYWYRNEDGDFVTFASELDLLTFFINP